MGIYDHKRILSDWSNGTLTADMAIGHALQHIAELYELLAQQRKSVNDKVNHLENRLNTLQVQFDRLTKGVSAELEQAKKPASPAPIIHLPEVSAPQKS